MLESTEQKASVPKKCVHGQKKRSTQIYSPRSSNFQMPGWGCGASQTPPGSVSPRLPPSPAHRGGQLPPELGGFTEPTTFQPLPARLSAGMLQTSPKTVTELHKGGRTGSDRGPVPPGDAGTARSPARLHLPQPRGFVQSSRSPAWAFFIPGCSYVDILSCATGSSAAR